MKLKTLVEAKDKVKVEPFVTSDGKKYNEGGFKSSIPRLDFRPEGNPMVINRKRTDEDNKKSKEYVTTLKKDYEDFKKYLEVNNLMAPYASMKLDAFKNADKIFVVAEMMDEIIDTFNDIVGVLNEAAEKDDVEAFKAGLRDLKSLVLKNNPHSSVLKRRMTIPMMLSVMRASMASSFEYITQCRDNAEKYAKRMTMSPAQREAAQKTSQRMKMAWAE